MKFLNLRSFLKLSFFNSQLQHFQEAALVNQSGKEFCRQGMGKLLVLMKVV